MSHYRAEYLLRRSTNSAVGSTHVTRIIAPFQADVKRPIEFPESKAVSDQEQGSTEDRGLDSIFRANATQTSKPPTAPHRSLSTARTGDGTWQVRQAPLCSAEG